MLETRSSAEALATARRYASGGAVHEGFLHSTVPGRTDRLPISVSGGAYVLPADHVAALGQGNSLSGADIVNKMFKMGPYGSSPSALKGSKVSVPRLNLRSSKFVEGGTAEPTDIIAAGGEIVIPPDKIAGRFGDLDRGHKALDKWVIQTRKKHVDTLRGLKPPKKD